MPASSNTSAAYWSYAVSIAHFSPRSFSWRRWWTRTRRGATGWAGSPAGGCAAAGPDP
jgi:hypothetical protein